MSALETKTFINQERSCVNPNCKEPNTEDVKGTEYDGVYAWNQLICTVCGWSWYPVYKLIKVEQVKNADDEEIEVDTDQPNEEP